jgi:mRNA interferase RelE/StbE
MRQRVRRALRELIADPRPPRSRRLAYSLVGAEPRRLRIDGWRVIYAVVDSDPPIVAVVAVRPRPPYDYDDLDALFGGLPDR